MLEFLLNKVTYLQPTQIKKKAQTQVFSSEFCEIFQNTFLESSLRTTVFENNLTAFVILSGNFSDKILSTVAFARSKTIIATPEKIVNSFQS